MTPDRKAFEEKITNALLRVARESRGEEEYDEPAPPKTPVMHSGADVVVMQNPGLTVGALVKWGALLAAIFGAGYLLRGWGEATNGTSNLWSSFKKPQPPPEPPVYTFGNSQMPLFYGPQPASAGVTTTLPDGRSISSPSLGEASHALALLAKENR